MEKDGHAQQCGDLQGWRECIRGLNGNRKNTIKDLKKENTQIKFNTLS